MFDRLKKHFALKTCIKKLGPSLRERYGKFEFYTLGQINATSQIIGLDDKYLPYGYALFCKESQFTQELSKNRNPPSYQTLRQELADKFFEGNPDFNTSDLIAEHQKKKTGSQNSDGGTSIYH